MEKYVKFQNCYAANLEWGKLYDYLYNKISVFTADKTKVVLIYNFCKAHMKYNEITGTCCTTLYYWKNLNRFSCIQWVNASFSVSYSISCIMIFIDWGCISCNLICIEWATFSIISALMNSMMCFYKFKKTNVCLALILT